MIRRIVLAVIGCAPWALLALIVFSTLGPQQLRPHSPFGAQPERFIAYALAASSFSVLYPKRRWAIAISGIIIAVALELGQGLVPGRDPGLQDVIAKVLGAIFGVGSVSIVDEVLGGALTRWVDVKK